MKILLLTEYFPTTLDLDIHGGVEERVYYTAKYLSQFHKVTVITARLVDQPIFQTLGNIRIIRAGPARNYGRSGLVISRSLFLLAAIWQGIFLKFDLVEGTGLMSYLPAWVLGWKARLKILVVADVVEAYLEDVPAWLRILLKYGEILLLRKKWNKIVCISEAIRQKLLKYGVEDHNLVVNYCGVNLQEITSIKDIKSVQPLIVCVSRLVPYKRISDLLEALVGLKLHIPQTRCVIIGSGEEQEKLKQLTIKLHLTENVQFMGFIKKHRDVIKYIKQAHVFCLPSTVEGFGIATVEALACNIPVVLPDTRINHEITRDMGVAFFEPKNALDLSRKLYQVLSDQVFYRRLVKETGIIGRRYEWRKHAQNMEKIYEDLRPH